MSCTLSIIVPYYNSRCGLEKLLTSIPDDPEIEVIVVNDHSDDVSDLVFKRSNLRVFMQEKNKRWAGAARNLALEHSNGTFVTFADSDDYFVTDFKFINKLSDDIDVYYFRPTSAYADGSLAKRHVKYADLIDEFSISKNNKLFYKFYVPWSKVIKRSLIEDNNIRFDEVVASNDINFSLKVAYFSDNVAIGDESIYCVTDSADSLTKQKSEQVIDSRFDAVCRYNDFLYEVGEKSSGAAMSGHLLSAFKISRYKFLSRFFYCKYKGYKVFYGVDHIIKVVKRSFRK